MTKRTYLFLALIQFFCYCCYAQPPQETIPSQSVTTINNPPAKDQKRLTWGLGYSFGYSSHADSYFVNTFTNREYPGLRLIVVDARVGWMFHKKMALFGIGRFSPSNATISPYRSLYYGGYLSYYPYASRKLSLQVGTGKYQSKISKEETAGDGLLTNIGSAYQFNDRGFFEINILLGKLDPGNVQPNPFDRKEVNMTLGIGFVF